MASAIWQGWMKRCCSGLGSLKPLTRKPESCLLPVDLIKLLKKFDETLLVLNVLRPLLAKSEREVRQHVVQWVETIRQTPNLDPQTKESWWPSCPS